MQELTEHQQNVVDKCYEMLREAGLESAEIGTPIPPRKPK